MYLLLDTPMGFSQNECFICFVIYQLMENSFLMVICLIRLVNNDF